MNVKLEENWPHKAISLLYKAHSYVTIDVSKGTSLIKSPITKQGDVTQGELLAAAARGCCQPREMVQPQEKLGGE